GGRASGACASWDALVVEAGRRMPNAVSLTRAELPEALLYRHGSRIDRAFLGEVISHSARVFSSIRGELGSGYRLPREPIVKEIVDTLQHEQVVLVAGAAGSGKSAVARMALDALAHERLVFAA